MAVDVPVEAVTPPPEPPPQPLPDPAPLEVPGPAHRGRWKALLVFPGVLAFAVAVELLIARLAMDDRRFDDYVLGGRAFGPMVLDTFIWCLVLGAVVFISGRFWIPATVFLALGIVVAQANSVKLELRTEPIYPGDFHFAGQVGFLKDMVEPGSIVRLALVLLGVGVGGWVLARLSGRWLPRAGRTADPSWWKRLLLARIVAALCCVGLLALTAQFNTPGNVWRKAYNFSGADWKAWNQKWNYNRNGFVGGFLFNFRGPVMPRPQGYDRDTMEAVLEKYQARAGELNIGRNPAAFDDVNVVVVLSETFTDPLQLEGITFAEDPIPHTRKLLAETYSGRMLTQKIGGGTANMEFEVLTGLSLAQLAPQVDTPYQMIVPRFRTFPSAAHYFAGLEHDTLGIHPFDGAFYKRRITYPRLGIEKFVDIHDMEHTGKIKRGKNVSDEAAYRELDDHLARSDAPLFVNLVTMQNHYPYARKYTDPIQVTGLGPKHANEAGRYARGLAHTDTATHEWLQRLTRSKEKTVVIFYGDHLPASYPAALMAENGKRVTHETPFFLWSNFTDFPHVPLPTTSPIHFLPQLFDLVGAPVPPLYALLDELGKHVPAMEQGRYFDAEDREVREDRLSAEGRKILHDYRLVQYDIVAGKHYVQDEMYAPPTPN